jgi:two-component system, NtrC family, response regulator AlgB
MRILVIDDEPNIRQTTSVCLETMGHECVAVESGSEALQQIERVQFDAAFLDLRLNNENGLEVLDALLRVSPGLAVVVFTAHSSIETAVEAMRRGAEDYLPKPFTPETIRQTLKRIFRTRRLERRVAELESRVAAESPAEDWLTDEPFMQRVYEVVLKAAPTPATVLILGESGTGKGVVARQIHEKSLVAESTFVTVNCPCLSRDLLESQMFGHVKGAFTGAVSDSGGKVAAADGGTLFLDEIGELPLELQPKLLRLLQEREYERVGESKTRSANVRLIVATNRDLAQAVRDGKFREDLYYRLNVISVTLPPLRERPRDLARLSEEFLRFFAGQTGKTVRGFAPEAWTAIQNYRWPGNVRELRNAIERSVILNDGPEIIACALPETLQGKTSSTPELGARVSLLELEAEHIRRVIANCRNLEEAAQVLGIDPTTLYRKRKRMETSGASDSFREE